MRPLLIACLVISVGLASCDSSEDGSVQGESERDAGGRDAVGDDLRDASRGDITDMGERSDARDAPDAGNEDGGEGRDTADVPTDEEDTSGDAPDAPDRPDTSDGRDASDVPEQPDVPAVPDVPADMADDPADVADDPTDVADDPIDTNEDAPSDVPDDAPFDAREDIPFDFPDFDAPDDLPFDAPQDVPVDVRFDLPDFGPELDMAFDGSEDVPFDAPDTPADLPLDTPFDAPFDTPEDIDDGGFDGTFPDGGDGDVPDQSPEDPLAYLSDDFDSDELGGQWTVLNGHLVDLEVADGALTLTANQRSLWYQNNEGPFVYTEVLGDFAVSATVRARSAQNPELPPPYSVHLGGLMARDPASEGDSVENYVFIVAGHDVDDISVETKTTTDGVSEFTGPSWPSGDAELRICRVRGVFALYKREIGSDDWGDPAAVFFREDLPDELQIGPLVYANREAPDLVVTFDEVTFSTRCP